MKHTNKLGRTGEIRAVNFLKQKGFLIIKTNYRTSDGEIDVIARDGDTLVFIEVKSRRSSIFGTPEEAVDLIKQKQLKKIAQQFISQYQMFDIDCRFDIIALYYQGSAVQLKYIPNAFH